MTGSRSAGPLNEEPPPSGGVFRRLAPSEGSALVGAFGVVETVFAPAHEQARADLERQRITGARQPSATDPPGDDEDPGENRVAAPGRRGTPFSGVVVIRRPPPGTTPGTTPGPAVRARRPP